MYWYEQGCIFLFIQWYPSQNSFANFVIHGKVSDIWWCEVKIFQWKISSSRNFKKSKGKKEKRKQSQLFVSSECPYS